jgi:hypothetical protein
VAVPVITIDGIDVTNSIPLETLHIEEVIDSRAQCSFTIQDTANSVTVAARSDVKIVEGASTLFRGTVMTRRYVQHVGFRDIDITCSDYSVLLDERMVGVPSGGLWLGPDTQGNYISVDPNGNTSATDATTIRDLFATYVGGPILINTTTYVNTYVPNSYLGSHILYWSRTPLRSALSELRDVAGPNVHFWIDPDLNFHWVAFPLSSSGSLLTTSGSLPLRFPETTGLVATGSGIAEAASVDYVTYYGVQDPPGLQVTYDGTTMTQQPYIAGLTDYIYTPSGTQTVTLPVGSGLTATVQENVPVVQGGGQGFYPFTDAQGIQGADATLRQAIVSSDASSLTERATDGAMAIVYSGREIIRGQATVRSVSNVYHVGQSLAVYFPTAMGLNGSYPINHVTTQYLKGDGTRDTTLDFGDAPVGRFTQRRPTPVAGTVSKPPRPATRLEVGTPADVNPLAGTTQPVVFKITDFGGVPIEKQMAKTVYFTLFYVRPPAVGLLASPPASLNPASATFNLPGVATTNITFTSAAVAGDKAWVAAFVDDT